MTSLGIKIKKINLDEASIKRVTAESNIEVEVYLNEKELNVSTGYNFLNHMIESIFRWGSISIKINVETQRSLSHLVAEDSGITLGLALRQLSKIRIEEVGIEGIGFASAPLDEALSEAVVSIEGRSNAYIEPLAEGALMAKVEDLYSKDLIAFLEGLAQGWGVTLHLRILKGDDPHHSWESAFRALGLAISQSLKKNPSRKGEIPGIKSIFEI